MRHDEEHATANLKIWLIDKDPGSRGRVLFRQDTPCMTGLRADVMLLMHTSPFISEI